MSTVWIHDPEQACDGHPVVCATPGCEGMCDGEEPVPDGLMPHAATVYHTRAGCPGKDWVGRP